MEPFYFFSHNHTPMHCATRPPRSLWRAGTVPAGTQDGWSWRGRKSLRYYAYPSSRWLPPPLHHRYRSLPLPPLVAERLSAAVPLPGREFIRRAWVGNKCARRAIRTRAMSQTPTIQIRAIRVFAIWIRTV